MAIKNLTEIRTHLFMCSGGSCKLLGAEESIAAIRAAIKEAGLSEEVHTTKTFCNGRCKDGPVVISQPAGLWFKQMTKDKAVSFVRSLMENRVLQENVLYRYGRSTINNV
jgi:(2Fe-2S) ferredoxin